MGNKEFYWSGLKLIHGSVSFFVDVGCTVTISSTPPLNGLICVGRTVGLTVAYTSDNGSAHKILGGLLMANLRWMQITVYILM